jgi:HAD superfamily hydrolase (TIGR01509 family)
MFVFDLDGVLYDDLLAYEDFCQLSQAFLKSHGIQLPDGIKEYQKMLRAKWKVASTADALAKEFSTPIEEIASMLYLPINLDTCEVPRENPQIVKLLTGLCGKKLVMTSSPTAFVEKVLAHMQIRDFFDEVIGCEQAPLGKDSPSTFTSLASRHPAEEEYVLIDDSPSNTRSAMDAGWTTALFQRRSHTEGYTEGDSKSYTFKIHDLNELAKLFESR